MVDCRSKLTLTLAFILLASPDTMKASMAEMSRSDFFSPVRRAVGELQRASQAASTADTSSASDLVVRQTGRPERPPLRRRGFLALSIPASLSLLMLGRKTAEAASPASYDRDAFANALNHQARELGDSVYSDFCKDNGIAEHHLLETLEKANAERLSVLQSSEAPLHPDRDYLTRLTAEQILNMSEGAVCNRQLVTLWVDGQLSSTENSAATLAPLNMPSYAQLERTRQLLLDKLRTMTITGQQALALTPVQLALRSDAVKTPGVISPNDFATGILTLLLVVDEADPEALPSIGMTLTHSARARKDVTQYTDTWMVPQVGQDEQGRPVFQDQQMELASQRQFALQMLGQSEEEIGKLEAEYGSLNLRLTDLVSMSVLGRFKKEEPSVWQERPRPPPRRDERGNRPISSAPQTVLRPATSAPVGATADRPGLVSQQVEGRQRMSRRRFIGLGLGITAGVVLPPAIFTLLKPQYAVNFFFKTMTDEADAHFPGLTNQLFSFLRRGKSDSTTKFVTGATSIEMGGYLHTPLTNIPQLTQSALVALEDDQFYYHAGVNAKGLLRGLWTGRGTSTLTMQLVEWLMYEQLGSLEAYEEYYLKMGAKTTKGAEMILASALETAMHQAVSELHPDWTADAIKEEVKNRILEWYFNTVAMGTGLEARGIQGALLTYTTVKKLSDLNEKEQVAFGLLPNRPGLFSSAFSSEQREKLILVALKRMVETQQLSQSEATRISTQRLEHIRAEVVTNPYYEERSVAKLGSAADYIALVANQQAELTGSTAKQSRTISLDEHLRQRAGQVEVHMHTEVQAKLDELRTAHEKDYLISADQYRQVSIIVRGARSGKVYGFVGNTFDFQPGSTAKLAQYHDYFASGKYDQHSELTDSEFSIVLKKSAFDEQGQMKTVLEPWQVTNDGNGSFGTQEIRKLLAQSGNRVVTWLAMRRLGLGMRESFRRFGLIDETPGFPRSRSAIHMASCLGAFNTSILRLVRMAATISNNGVDVGNAFVKKITDDQGERWASQPQSQLVGDENACQQIKEILSNPDNVTQDEYWQPFLDQSLPHYFKTGTNDIKPNRTTGGVNQDGICIGATTERVKRGKSEELAVAVVVHDQGGKGATGLIDAAPLALEALKLADRLVA